MLLSLLLNAGLTFCFCFALLLQSGWTGLHWAADYGHTEVVSLLLGAGANKEARDKVGGGGGDWRVAHQHKHAAASIGIL